MRAALLAGLLLYGAAQPAAAHEIYTGLKNKDSGSCCGANDCFLTSYRERGGGFEFLTREDVWVAIPVEEIIFLPIPGDPPHNDTHAAHLCYRLKGPSDVSNAFFRVYGPIFLYCAFIPPGAI